MRVDGCVGLGWVGHIQLYKLLYFLICDEGGLGPLAPSPLSTHARIRRKGEEDDKEKRGIWWVYHGCDEVIDELHLDHNESVFLAGGYDGISWLSALDSYSHDGSRMQRRLVLPNIIDQ